MGLGFVSQIRAVNLVGRAVDISTLIVCDDGIQPFATNRNQAIDIDRRCDGSGFAKVSQYLRVGQLVDDSQMKRVARRLPVSTAMLGDALRVPATAMRHPIDVRVPATAMRHPIDAGGAICPEQKPQHDRTTSLRIGLRPVPDERRGDTGG